MIARDAAPALVACGAESHGYPGNDDRDARAVRTIAG
jgi:hypothetical protein